MKEWINKWLKNTKTISPIERAFVNDIKELDTVIERLEKLEKENGTLYQRLHDLSLDVRKLQRVRNALIKLIDCIEEPELSQAHEIDLAIKEARQVLKETK